MNQANHRHEVEKLLYEWVQNEKQAKNIVNCLVDFLFTDISWLKSNISRIDRDIIVEAASVFTAEKRAVLPLSVKDDRAEGSCSLTY